MAPRRDFANKLLDFLEAKFLMSHFAPAETQRHFHFHVIAHEVDGMGQLRREIVRINARAELDFLHAIGVLVLLAFLFLFGLLVAVFAEIDNAAHWRRGIGCDFDEIHTLLPGEVDSFGESHDAELGALVTDNADFAGADFPVNPYE